MARWQSTVRRARAAAVRQRRGATAPVAATLAPDRRVIRSLLSLLSGYLLVAVVAAAMLAGHPDPRAVSTMAPVALVAALILAPLALGYLLVRRSRRLDNPALATLGATVGVATAALSAMLVVSVP